MAKHRKQTYVQRKPNARLVIFKGRSKIDVDGGATERDVRAGC